MAAKILVFSGSSREGSVNGQLAALAARELQALGAEVTFINLGKYPLPLVDATGFGNAPKEAGELRALIDEHDGLFIASPGPMGAYRGLTQMRTVLELGFGATLVPEMVAVGNAASAFAENGGLADERTAGFLKATLTRLVSMAEKLKA